MIGLAGPNITRPSDTANEMLPRLQPSSDWIGSMNTPGVARAGRNQQHERGDGHHHPAVEQGLAGGPCDGAHGPSVAPEAVAVAYRL